MAKKTPIKPSSPFHHPVTVRFDDELWKLFNEFKEKHKMLNSSAARYIMVEGLKSIYGRESL